MKTKLLTAMMLAVTLPVLAAVSGTQVVANVNGLVCDYCAQVIHESLMKQPGITGAKVDLTAKTVTVDLKEGATMPEGQLKKLLKDAGYDMTSYKVE